MTIRLLSIWALTAVMLLPAASCSIFRKSTPPAASNKPVTPKPKPDGNAEDAAMRFRREITGEAQKYVGVPYQYAGKNPSTGFDCSGFTHYVLGKYNVKVSPSSSVQATEGKEVPLNKVKPGDLIIFRTEDGKSIQHVSMVVENTPSGIVCVHSTTSRGVIVENVSTSSYWKVRIWKARDVIGK